jgi:hypothetical protein
MVHVFDPFDPPKRETIESDELLCIDQPHAGAEVVHHVSPEPIHGEWVCTTCGYSTITAKA